MTFQEILEGITRHRAAALAGNANVIEGKALEWAEIDRRINEVEWALQALAEALRDREQELKALLPPPQGTLTQSEIDEFTRNGARNEVDAAFDEYEKRE